MFPSVLETMVTTRANTTKVKDSHPADHNQAHRLINALQAKVGIDGSDVTTTHDYKLSEVISSDKAVGKTATQTLTNKTLTSPIISTIVNTGTLTLPTSTDTLVGRSTTDTLANKTLTTPVIADFTNATHDHSANSKGGQLNASTVFSAGTVPSARLGSGTADNSTVLYGDGAWRVPATTYQYGDGSDGAVTISSPTTLTRDMYYTNLTVNDTLTTNGYKIYVSGTLSGSGTIDYGTASNGSDGGVGGGDQGAGGSGASSTGGGIFKTQAGANGAAGVIGGSSQNGSASTSLTSALGARGGAGGSSSGTGGSSGTIAITQKFGVLSFTTIQVLDITTSAIVLITTNSTGGGGGGGGNAGSSGWNNGGGGGGGASGGTVFIVANVWAGTFTIKAVGGNGGIGGATNHASQTAYAGGGGGGGGGGTSIVIYGTKTWTGSYNIAGGTGGLGGATGGGSRASSGSNGSTGVSYEIDMSTLTR